jgi:hypothetical protein
MRLLRVRIVDMGIWLGTKGKAVSVRYGKFMFVD